MKLIYSKSVTKDVKKIKDKRVISQITKVIEAIISSESITEVKEVKRIKGHPLAYRVKIEKFRLGVYVKGDEVTLIRFVKRNDIYKVFP